MDASTVEYLLYLRENASQLREEAKGLGFTEDQIKECIEEALKECDIHTDSNIVNSPKNITRKCFYYFRVLVKTSLAIIGVLIAIWTCLMLMVSYNEATGKFFSNAIQPYGYEIFRAVRLVTLPIHDMLNITGELMYIRQKQILLSAYSFVSVYGSLTFIHHLLCSVAMVFK